MQSRLSPKVDESKYQAFPGLNWWKEFVTAKDLGFDAIEWIVDTNPESFINDKMVTKIYQTVMDTEVFVRSVCCDYLMEHPLHSLDKLSAEKSLDVLKYLIVFCQQLGAQYITIPCVDKASFIDDFDINLFAERIKEALILTTKTAPSVYLCLECDLPPKRVLSLIEEINHPNFKITYDTGNSAAMGYNCADELSTYGKHVKVVHVKDRQYNGPSVKFGRGHVDFELLVKTLKKIKFNGLFTLQPARFESDDLREQIEFTSRQSEFFKSYLERYFYGR